MTDFKEFGRNVVLDHSWPLNFNHKEYDINNVRLFCVEQGILYKDNTYG